MREEDREQMRKDMYSGTPRSMRAQRFADTVLLIMRDFVPVDREVNQRMYDHLLEIGYLNNAEFINVPPECDHMDKLALERRRFELSAAPLLIRTDAEQSAESHTLPLAQVLDVKLI